MGILYNIWPLAVIRMWSRLGEWGTNVTNPAGVRSTTDPVARER